MASSVMQYYKPTMEISKNTAHINCYHFCVILDIKYYVVLYDFAK